VVEGSRGDFHKAGSDIMIAYRPFDEQYTTSFRLIPKSNRRPQLQIHNTTKHKLNTKTIHIPIAVMSSVGQKVCSPLPPFRPPLRLHPNHANRTKVTNDPRAGNKINEAVGVVTSDSLAAESLSHHGAFGAGNPKAAASDQSSSSTTTNTTDTSAARKLDSAVNSEAREAQEGWSENAKLTAGGGLGRKDAGIVPTYNTSGGGGGHASSTGGHASSAGSGNTSASGHVPTAPTGSYPAHADPSTQKPKGKNITEGGFDTGAPNASFNSDIGDKNDPGRRAEANFQNRDAQPGVPLQSKNDANTTVYDALKSDEAA
jgi:hypothetical protein